jgi:hypothetical protein
MPKEQTCLEQWILNPSRYLLLRPPFNCYLRPQAGRQTCRYPHLIPSHDSSWWSLRRSKHFPLSTRYSIVAISMYLMQACFPCPSHLFVSHPATDPSFFDRISLQSRPHLISRYQLSLQPASIPTNIAKMPSTISLIRPCEIPRIVSLNTISTSKGCSCGTYTIFSSVCGHVYQNYDFTCPKCLQSTYSGGGSGGSGSIAITNDTYVESSTHKASTSRLVHALTRFRCLAACESCRPTRS